MKVVYDKRHVLGCPGADSGVRAQSLTPRSNQNVNSQQNLCQTGIEKAIVLVRRMNVSILGIKGLTKKIREDKKTFSFSFLRNSPCPNNLTEGMNVLVPYGK